MPCPYGPSPRIGSTHRARKRTLPHSVGTATPVTLHYCRVMAAGRMFLSRVRGRRSLRLRGHDYRSAGTYFVTICAGNRVPIFGEVVRGRVHLSPAGRIAKRCWLEIPRCHPRIQLDAFVVMPDHIHGILTFADPPTTPDRPRRFGDAVPGSLSTILGAYKAQVTKRINALRHTPDKKVWQRNYFEHIVRNTAALQRIRRYIITNPVRWKGIGGRAGNM